MDAIEGKVKELRKGLSSLKAELRYGSDGLKKAERRHHDLETDDAGIRRGWRQSREILKKKRLALMRLAAGSRGAGDGLQPGADARSPASRARPASWRTSA